MNHFALRYMCLLRKYGEAPQSNTTTCFIIDDTVLEKSGVRMEGVSRVFNHVKGRCVLGYKLLLCAFFDGKTTIPFDFSLHQEKGKQGDCGLIRQQFRKVYHTTDSWFTCEQLMACVRSIGKGAMHFVGLAKMGKTKYTVSGRKKNSSIMNRVGCVLIFHRFGAGA